jgi:hypothetical protein
MDGYMITKNVTRAFDLGSDPRVRYVGSLDDGGFDGLVALVAFDGDAGDLYEIANHVGGRALVAVHEPHPDYPPSWPVPHPHPAPKRQIGTGSERFSLVPIERPDKPVDALGDLARLYPDARLAIVHGNAALGDDRPMILTETDGDVIAEASWSAVVVTFFDKRLPAPVDAIA